MSAFVATEYEPFKNEIMVDALWASVSIKFTETLVFSSQQESFKHSLASSTVGAVSNTSSSNIRQS